MAEELIAPPPLDTNIDPGNAAPASAPPPAAPPPPGASSAPAGNDWSETVSKIANGDKAKTNILSRYNGVEALANAVVEVQTRFSKGEIRSVLPKNATPEQVSKWREENNIPTAPEKYDLKFDNGFVVDKTEIPNLDAFLTQAFDENMTHSQVKSMIQWHYGLQEQIQEQRIEEDKRISNEVIDELHGQWGRDFTGNMARVKEVLQTAPKGVGEKLIDGRTSDGTPIGSSPEILNWIVSLSKQLNPAGSLPSSIGHSDMSTIQARIGEITNIMSTDRKRYNSDQGMQTELLELNRQMERASEAQKRYGR
jgi:hypothetical protein